MHNNKKLVFFFTNNKVGGAQRVLLTIAKLLPKDEYESKIIIVDRDLGDIIKFIPSDIQYTLIKILNIWDFTTCKILKLLQNEKPYAVYSSFLYLNSRLIIASRIVGNTKIIVRSENMFWSFRKDIQLLSILTLGKADYVIFQTQEMKDSFKYRIHLNEDKVRVIHNPIDKYSIASKLENADNPYSFGSIDFVYVGRITYSKGLDVLLKSFSKVLSVIPNSRLTIVGKIEEDFSYYKKLCKLILDLNIFDSVFFTGFTDNPYKYIKFANCFILPSRIEGLPNVLLDALYMQVPVVVTRSVPVIERLVEKGRGIIINVDDEEDLVKAMIESLKLKISKPYDYPCENKFIELFA